MEVSIPAIFDQLSLVYRPAPVIDQLCQTTMPGLAGSTNSNGSRLSRQESDEAIKSSVCGPIVTRTDQEFARSNSTGLKPAEYDRPLTFRDLEVQCRILKTPPTTPEKEKVEES
jgi:hypothetical protein